MTIKLGAAAGVYSFNLHLYRFHSCFLTQDDLDKTEGSNSRAAQSVTKRRRQQSEPFGRSIVEALGGSPTTCVADELPLLVMLGGRPSQLRPRHEPWGCGVATRPPRCCGPHRRHAQEGPKQHCEPRSARHGAAAP
jgi:hypothetical protein